MEWFAYCRRGNRSRACRIVVVSQGITPGHVEKKATKAAAKNATKKVIRQRLYGGYVARLAQQFEEELNKIATNHNFEYGDEFEIAICRILRLALPHKYGVCRGYVVTADGALAGDDILIYDRLRFPTLRALSEDYSLKEQVPIEAVYCYIEAKHTLELQGKGDSSLHKAKSQVLAVRKLCNRREVVGPQDVLPYVVLEDPLTVKMSPQLPKQRNPIFTAIIARNIREKPRGSVIEDLNAINQLLAATDKADAEEIVDVVIAGKHNIVVPVRFMGKRNSETLQLYFTPPFFVKKHSKLSCCECEGLAFGVGIALLLSALDWIDLGSMPWESIVLDGLGISPAHTAEVTTGSSNVVVKKTWVD